MQHSLANPTQQTQLKDIKNDEKVINLFNFAFLMLMANNGTTSIINAANNLNSTDRTPLSGIKLGTTITATIVNIMFILMNIAANQVARAKKQTVLKLKAEQLKTNGSVQNLNQVSIRKSVERSRMYDILFNGLASMLVVLSLVFNTISITQQIDGQKADAARSDLAANGCYLLAVLVTLFNKVVGDVRLTWIEKHYIQPSDPQASAKPGLFSRITGLFRKTNEEQQPLIEDGSSERHPNQDEIERLLQNAQ